MGMDCGCSCHNKTLGFQALYGSDMKNNTCNIADPLKFSFLDNCCVSSVAYPKITAESCCPKQQLPFDAGYGVDITNSSSDLDPALGGGEKCSIAGSSQCPELRERF